MEELARFLDKAEGTVNVITNLELLQNLVYGLIAVTILLIIFNVILLMAVRHLATRIHALEWWKSSSLTTVTAVTTQASPVPTPATTAPQTQTAPPATAQTTPTRRSSDSQGTVTNYDRFGESDL